MNDLLARFWRGKRILVTGASSGLGAEIVRQLSAFDVRLCLMSRRREKMQALVDELNADTGAFMIMECDVRERKAVQACIDRFVREHGGIDVAWVNSGISLDSSFEKWRWENFENQVDTNLKGAVYTSQACLEVMVPQGGGHIVGIGSAASMRGLPQRGVYSLTKISLDFFLQSRAIELPFIDFTIIHPGFVDTPINQGNPNRIFLVSPQRAVRLMLKAVAKRRRVYIYPWQMNILYRFMRALPTSLYYPLARRTIRISEPSGANQSGDSN